MAAPEGLVYTEEVIDRDEERGLLDFLARIDYAPVVMRGQASRRTVRHYGLGYEYESWRLTPTDPLPAQLEWLRERAADLAGVDAETLAQTLVTRYPPGSTIGWHRDAPSFGTVIGVSLASACRMRFQRGKATEREVFELELAPRSGYVLTGEVRNQWQHSIPATRDERYSVTFRTLRRRDA